MERKGDKIMRKDFGPKTWLYPMPVLIVAAYDEAGKANAMNAAWGGIYDTNQIIICLSEEHKTTKNIEEKKAFTVNITDVAHMVAADYVGIVSGNTVPDKLEKAGFHTEHSKYVDAPLISELPMALECKLVRFTEEGSVIGEIVNVSAAENVLNSDGQPDASKIQAITYDPIGHHYLVLGEAVGMAFKEGKALK